MAEDASFEFGVGSSMFDPTDHGGFGSSEAPFGTGSQEGSGQAQSLVFGGGGDFLSKYHARQQNGHQAEIRMRHRGSASGAHAGSQDSSKASSGPDRAHVQLNSSLVHAKNVDKILMVVEAHFNHFNAVNMITALHRLATLVVASRKSTLRRDPRFKRLIQKLSETLRIADHGVLKPQDLSNVAWALTKLGLLNNVLFRQLAVHIAGTVKDFEPVNLSMTLWAFACSGFLDEELFRATVGEVKHQLPAFKPQQIANTTWAIAKSGYVDEELFSLAAELALKKLDDFEPMNYSMLLYSFSLAKQPNPMLFEQVGKRCSVQSLSGVASVPHVVTNLALAFSEAGIVNTDVFDTIARVARHTLKEYRTQQISTLAMSFAGARVKNEKLFASISDVVVSRLSEFKAQDMKDLLAAYQTLGMSTEKIARAIEGSGHVGEGSVATQNPLNLAMLIILAPLVTYIIWRVVDVMGVR